ncbi:hypothetical protein [Paracoccus sp. (in: a-proteobacteria)]|uniref:hypothetical protein n=1 Tax=Paracoccus sp. TaxID=267 RepID=UPI00321F8A05
MTRQREGLAQLQRIARLKADLEMRRFAALRGHVDAARATVSRLEGEIEGLYRAERAFSPAEARLTNALAGDCGRALGRAERDLQRLLPAYEVARQAASRALGRAEALGMLQDGLRVKERREQGRLLR